eukprot:CAMPEP_0176209364 /NCGR_PEP_ID=MMETSP0121_2-20121125/13595_1 /TAXON_ID=160619 /ORGANISM="Kryptoperidinium foliaceum, Strain CCMP 1326" /LENGTH=141 /DNA_ID=CAMNT_0017548373 /DNA_START=65 /DNA_END=486 /DNA_ORIENTATION=+
MAAALVEQMRDLQLQEEAPAAEGVAVRFKVSGVGSFELELSLATAVRDVKNLAKEMCNIEPEHMRLLDSGRVLKESETLECYDTESEMAVQVMFTAGHTGLSGGSKGQVQQRNPFSMPVRGLPGSKGNRSSRMSGRLGGNA